jgi:membrane-associated phospholipid phosphatase
VIGTFALAVTLSLPGSPEARRAPPDADRPFTRVVQNLGEDVRGIPSHKTLIVAAVGAMGAAIAVDHADHRLADWVARRGDSAYSDLGDFLGNGWTEAGAAVSVYALGAAQHSPRTARVGSQLLRAQILNGLLTRALKSAVGRPRPNGGVDSFPSGHTSAAFASASILERTYGWKAGAGAYAAAAFVGWTRVRDNAHWLSDVIAGAALGTVVGQSVGRGDSARGWTVAPSVGNHAIGIRVIRSR